MLLSPSRWRPRQLILACGGYWAALALTVLARPAMTFLRLYHGPRGQLSVSAALGDAALRLSIARDGVTAWTGSARPLTIALWIAGPPLLLWLIWLARHPTHRAAAQELSASPEGHTLPAGPIPFSIDGSQRNVVQPQSGSELYTQSRSAT